MYRSLVRTHTQPTRLPECGNQIHSQTRTESRRSKRFSRPLYSAFLVGLAIWSHCSTSGAATYTWDAGGESDDLWQNANNWNPNQVPGATDVADFQDAVYENFNTAMINFSSGTNNGAANQAVGAITVTGSSPWRIQNQSFSTAGTLTLNGALVGSTSNVILSSSGPGLELLSTDASGRRMDIALGNNTQNVVLLANNGTVETDSIITGASKNLTVSGAGTLRFRGSSANTYSGLTAVSSGTLALTKDDGVTAVAGNLKVGNGTANGSARLAFEANNQVANGSAVELAGGTIDLNGNSEGSATAAGVGALTLSATSTINFGEAGEGNSIVRFASIAQSVDGTILQITNWAGTPHSFGGAERLLFSGTSNSFTTIFGQNEVSFNGISGYAVMDFSGFYEVTAVPEPSTVFAACAVVGMLGFCERRRLVKFWFARRRSAAHA